jgi:putative DNA-invertase from lambdoid prophage Rac
MALVRRGKIDIVAVYKLDRLGRSLSHLAGMIDEFSSHGVGLISVSQGIDTSANNAMAKMQLGMLSVFAEFERDLIRERTVAGLRAAQAKGTLLGRRNIDRHSSRVAELQGQGLSKRAIARAIGVAPSNVMRLLAKALRGGVRGFSYLLTPNRRWPFSMRVSLRPIRATILS